MNNTLFLGNGFNRAVYKNVSSWSSLFDGDISLLSNLTLLYEHTLMNLNWSDNQLKRRISETIRNEMAASNIKKSVYGLEDFGESLKKYNIDNIITSNLDKGIENVLTEKNGFHELWPRNINRDNGEKIYSIRRNVRLSDGNHTVKIWKIHGDYDNIASISLGFDQYCGSLSKMKEYINGSYVSSSGIKCEVPIYDKCIMKYSNQEKEDENKKEDKAFDEISWIELFFNSNVYIAGFGLDFSEIDIWWLLDKRSRLIKQEVPINNKVVFLYNEYDLQKADFNEKKSILDAFNVEYIMMNSERSFLTSMFKNIKNS